MWILNRIVTVIRFGQMAWSVSGTTEWSCSLVDTRVRLPTHHQRGLRPMDTLAIAAMEKTGGLGLIDFAFCGRIDYSS